MRLKLPRWLIRFEALGDGIKDLDKTVAELQHWRRAREVASFKLKLHQS